MKQKDIALIVVIVFISTLVSLLVSSSLISPSKQRNKQAEVVQAINADFPEPDKAYFNDKAFDPTQTITINPSNSTDPFSGTSN